MPAPGVLTFPMTAAPKQIPRNLQAPSRRRGRIRRDVDRSGALVFFSLVAVVCLVFAIIPRPADTPISVPDSPGQYPDSAGSANSRGADSTIPWAKNPAGPSSDLSTSESSYPRWLTDLDGVDWATWRVLALGGATMSLILAGCAAWRPGSERRVRPRSHHAR